MANTARHTYNGWLASYRVYIVSYKGVFCYSEIIQTPQLCYSLFMLRKSYRAERAKYHFTCATCKKTQPCKRKTRKFCNRRCREVYSSLRFRNPELFKASNPLLRTNGTKPRSGKIHACLQCGVDVYVNPSRLRRSKKFFCSCDCMYRYKTENTIFDSILCKVCDSPIKEKPSTLKHRPRKTCSKKCLKKYKRQQALLRRQSYTRHQLDRLQRYSQEAKEWRALVFKRDDYTCQVCHKRGGYLEADHIKPWAFFPKLRFELSNGRTLCRGCHDKTKISYIKMREIYGRLLTM